MQSRTRPFQPCKDSATTLTVFCRMPSKKIIQETSMKKHLSVPRTGLHPGNNPAYAPYPRTSTEKFGHENC